MSAITLIIHIFVWVLEHLFIVKPMSRRPHFCVISLRQVFRIRSALLGWLSTCSLQLSFLSRNEKSTFAANWRILQNFYQRKFRHVFIYTETNFYNLISFNYNKNINYSVGLHSFISNLILIEITFPTPHTPLRNFISLEIAVKGFIAQIEEDFW